MKTTNFANQVFRLTLSQASQLSTQASSNAASSSFTAVATAPDRVVTRSATMLALLGIALSSFSLKQLLANNNNKNAVLRKL